MKILYIIDNLGVGGAQRQLFELIRGLTSKNKTQDTGHKTQETNPRTDFEIILCSLSDWRNPLLAEFQSLGIRTVMIGHRGKFSVKTLLNLRKLIKSEKPDIINSYLFTSNMYGRLAAVFTGIPVICSSRGYDSWKEPHFVMANRILKPLAAHYIGNANRVMEFFRSIGIKDEKATLIYNGVDFHKFQLNGHKPPALRAEEPGGTQDTGHKTQEENPNAKCQNPKEIQMSNNKLETNGRTRNKYRTKYRISDNEKIVGIIAGLREEKDHATFLRASAIMLSKSKGIRFFIAGDGALMNNLKILAGKLGVADYAYFLGRVDDTETLMKEIDVLALCSVDEACSNVILEAMSAGVPVVATDVGGNPELVEDGVTGLLVPVRDEKALAEAMLKLLDDEIAAEAMRVAARERIEKKFSLKKMIDSTVEVYTELLLKKPKIKHKK